MRIFDPYQVRASGFWPEDVSMDDQNEFVNYDNSDVFSLGATASRRTSPMIPTLVDSGSKKPGIPMDLETPPMLPPNMIPVKKETNWLLYGAIGLAVWYFFIRKPKASSAAPVV